MDERDFYKQVGFELKASRELNGLTVEVMSEALGVEPNTIYRWENGSRRISIYQYVKWRDFIKSLSSQVIAMLRALFIISIVNLLVGFVVLGISIKLLKIELQKGKNQNDSSVFKQNWKIDKQKKW